MLGVRPIAGVTFAADDAAQRRTLVVLSERLWRIRFGGDPAIIGRAITLDGQPYTIVGVVPAGFQILYPADMWTLFAVRRSPEQRRQHYMQVVGRLKPGATLEQARADMAGVADRIAVVSPETNKGWGVTIEPLRDAIVGPELRTTSLVLAGVVAFVLLMACANVANLLLARGLGRSREIAVRAALGGSRWRIIQQLLTESLLLAAIGGACGLALAWAAVRAAPSLIPPGTLPQAIVLAFDARVAVVAAMLTLGTALLFGLVPAWQASSVPLAGDDERGRPRIDEARRRTARGARGRRGRGGGAAAGGRRPARAHADRAERHRSRLPRRARADDAGRPAAEPVRQHREAAGVLSGGGAGSVGDPRGDERGVRRQPAARRLGHRPGFSIVGDPPVEQSRMLSAHYQIVGAGYFRTLGIDVVRGRPFGEHDTAQAQQVCIVNEEFVRRHLNGREPIGMRLDVQSMDIKGGPTPVTREIVGVSRQVAEAAGEKERAVEIYVPIAQNPWFSASLAVQTAGEPMSFLPAVKAAIARGQGSAADADPHDGRGRGRSDVAAAVPRGAGRYVRGARAGTRRGRHLRRARVFVGQRAREFGIRIALGARSHDVLRLVLGGALKMTGAGVAIGLVAAALLTRLLGTLLFAVQPTDPITFAGTAAVLGAAALIACALPAWRAIRVDPAVTLRQE